MPDYITMVKLVSGVLLFSSCRSSSPFLPETAPVAPNQATVRLRVNFAGGFQEVGVRCIGRDWLRLTHTKSAPPRYLMRLSPASDASLTLGEVACPESSADMNHEPNCHYLGAVVGHGSGDLAIDFFDRHLWPENFTVVVLKPVNQRIGLFGFR